MTTVRRIGLVGDHDPSVPAHQAIPMALQLAANALEVDIHHEWVPTEEITQASRVARYDGLWCVPASPYRSMDGALLAIEFARLRPFRYGIDAEFHAALLSGPLRMAADDEDDEVRAIERDAPPFFVATLFQPERAALRGRLPPLVSAFVRAVVRRAPVR